MPLRSQARWEAVVDAISYYYLCGLRRPDEAYAKPCRTPFDPSTLSKDCFVSDLLGVGLNLEKDTLRQLLEPGCEVTRNIYGLLRGDQRTCETFNFFDCLVSSFLSIVYSPLYFASALVTLSFCCAMQFSCLGGQLAISGALKPPCCLFHSVQAVMGCACIGKKRCCESHPAAGLVSSRDLTTVKRTNKQTPFEICEECWRLSFSPEDQSKGSFLYQWLLRSMAMGREGAVDFTSGKIGGRGYVDVSPVQVQPTASAPMALPPLRRQPNIPNAEVKVDRSQELGKGGFGIVYRGTWKKIAVAVKELREQLSTGDTTAFQQEVATMSALDHPNIVILYGAVTDHTPHYMVMELMDTSLDKILRDPKIRDIPWPERMRYAHDIASGLGYLHEKSIVHRDLKSMNVLADKQRRLKLTDFGLARVKQAMASATSAYVGNVQGTVGWMAPELLSAEGQVEYKANTDIYSYAMTLWEIASCQIPYQGQAIHQIVIGVTSNKRPAIPADTPPALTKIMKDCWLMEPAGRPNIATVIAQLNAATHATLAAQNPGRFQLNPSFAEITGSGPRQAWDGASTSGPNFADITGVIDFGSET